MQASGPEGKDTPLHLAELACARVLHDLSGVVGTLAGTIELLADDGPPSDEMQLAAEAASTLNLRLRLLRAAWVGDGEARGPEDLAEMAAALPTFPRIRSDLSGLAPAALPAPLARVALCLLMAGAEGLPGGGTVAVSGDSGGLTARLNGPRAAWPAWLASGSPVPAPESSRALAAPMLVQAARLAGLTIRRAGGTGPADDLALRPG